MSTLVQIICVVLAIPFAALGIAKIRAGEEMSARAAHLGFSVDSYRVIGVAEVAAAAALLAAHWVPALATTALVGLVLLMVGAVVFHLRNGDGPDKFLAAAVLLALVAGTLAAALAS
jgi:hypothetical protein